MGNSNGRFSAQLANAFGVGLLLGRCARRATKARQSCLLKCLSPLGEIRLVDPFSAQESAQLLLGERMRCEHDAQLLLGCSVIRTLRRFGRLHAVSGMRATTSLTHRGGPGCATRDGLLGLVSRLPAGLLDGLMC